MTTKPIRAGTEGPAISDCAIPDFASLFRCGFLADCTFVGKAADPLAPRDFAVTIDDAIEGDGTSAADAGRARVP
ncbi:MAG TPA: hypothetical protein VGK20_06475 [Candidatus Binatia bacterium]|jgi:hypothetical protein